MIVPVTLVPAVLVAARIAIVASSNQAEGQATLRYADRDGERVGAVLTELGSIASEDVWKLPNTTVAALRAALDRAEERAQREPASTIILYYSGHADAAGLLIGDQRFTYRELRERLARSRAQVRVAVLDACNAGGATRPKGGHQSAGPVFTPVDPLRVDGAAILAATGTEELAQESSDVEGSYFTHHLISGLRGGGDRDGNGVITLGEAYAYVYSRTVAATAPSLWGPQHPSYDYRLSGTGDLALTTLARGRQGLTFEAAPEGTFTVVDGARDMVAELRADPRRAQRLALPAGKYHVTYRAAGRVSTAEVRVLAGADATVSRADLKDVGPELAFAKGGAPAARDALFLDVGLAGRAPSTATLSTELGLVYRHSVARWSLAARLSYGETNLDDLDVSYRLRRFSVAGYLLRPVSIGPIDLQVGGGVALTRALQTLSTGLELRATVPWAGGAMALELPIVHWLAVRMAWDVGAELVPIDGQWRGRLALHALLGLGLRR